jgi:RNA polymerase sigma factor (sigma-70 family)
MSDRGHVGCCDPVGAPARWSLAELVQGAREQDARCWDEIVTRFGPGLHRLARSYRLDEATCADVVQQSWLTAFVHLASLRDPIALGGWLQMITRRECLRVMRRRVKEWIGGWGVVGDPDEQDSMLELADDDPLPEDHVVGAELAELIGAARARLAGRDQEMLTFIAAGTVSYLEMARELDLRPGSVGPTRARCLGRLRAELAELGVDRTWLAA